MNEDEIFSLVQIMIDSGSTLDFGGSNRYVADKHSTGGIGDKISLILAPIMAAAGIKVPMIAGRGLGFTGGTIDKLESIPGFNSSPSLSQFKKWVDENGYAIMSQSIDICPADKKIYSLRSKTGTVASIPLICGSIMSKKIAEGIDGLVMDIKIGNGAFMKELVTAKDLGSILKHVGESFNVSTDIVFSNMDQPLGNTAGMWCEVLESINALKGQGADDLMAVVFELGSRLMLQAGIVETNEQAIQAQENNISSGRAYEKFEEMVENQQGNIRDAIKVNQPLFVKEITSDQEGFIESFDTTMIGWANVDMGCGRRAKSDILDNSAGIEFNVKVGDYVKKGDRVFRCFNSNMSKLEKACMILNKTYSIGKKKVETPELIYKN